MMDAWLKKLFGMAGRVSAGQRLRILSEMRSDPLIHQFTSLQVSRKDGVRITEPWMALAEQRSLAAILASDTPISIINPLPLGGEDLFRSAIATFLVNAETFLWSKNVFDITKECPMPPHVIGKDVLPSPVSYHSLEVGYHAEICGLEKQKQSAEGAHVGELEMDGILFMDLIDRFQTVALGTIGDRVMALICGIKYGMRFPDDIPEESQQPTAQILSMLAFLKSPYTEVTPRRLPRAWRRHGGVRQQDKEKEIRVILLRAAAERSVDSYNADARSYKHRWWVRGHFRAQWYPSKSAHEVIWIAPYLKGAEGAPMIEKVYAVKR